MGLFLAAVFVVLASAVFVLLMKNLDLRQEMHGRLAMADAEHSALLEDAECREMTAAAKIRDLERQVCTLDQERRSREEYMASQISSAGLGLNRDQALQVLRLGFVSKHAQDSTELDRG